VRAERFSGASVEDDAVVDAYGVDVVVLDDGAVHEAAAGGGPDPELWRQLVIVRGWVAPLTCRRAAARLPPASSLRTVG
jgi:hypothetical protein